MYSCKIAENFEGIDGELDANSFNDIICVLDNLILNDQVNEDFKDRFKVLKYKLLTLSKYDVAGEAVHIRLGLSELSLYSLALLSSIPDGKKDYFDLQVKSYPIKLWHISDYEGYREG